MSGLTALMLVLSLAAAQPMPPATYASGAALDQALADQPVSPMVVARVDNTDLTRVNLIHRTTPRNAIVHATGWEVHHIVKGSGTVVTGGTLARSVDSSGASVATIVGGERRAVSPGDVVVIPAGTPHWYSEIDGFVTYLEVRYDPGAE